MSKKGIGDEKRSVVVSLCALVSLAVERRERKRDGKGNYGVNAKILNGNGRVSESVNVRGYGTIRNRKLVVLVTTLDFGEASIRPTKPFSPSSMLGSIQNLKSHLPLLEFSLSPNAQTVSTPL